MLLLKILQGNFGILLNILLTQERETERDRATGILV